MSVSADDAEAIRQLLARYNHAVDFGDTAAWVACFTPDGVFECTGLPDGHPLGGRHDGPVALAAYAQRHYDTNNGTARHWNWNLVIDVTGDEATMRCYLGAQSGTGASAVLRSIGMYDDVLRRVQGDWRFASRRVHVG